ncbi:YtxH domain-containing protein [Facklamia sp. 7083-14-GEN3]|uniref:YtxH domain-containing protein n=1 Tax=Facklamia sp. 7083-14-GEN3 TaxID=2973478 RepID=UPI00215BFE20|nr:YtxH domain-containing protein [Facklamia sp. 7083-14-GEN3]MCR8968636.1 YtxH domain-containing protein [Facklamia sp. 7083-14-GEN3]
MKNFPQGFLTGLALGVLAGLMNAKQSGEKTRHQLKETYKDFKVDFEQVDQDYARFHSAIQSLSAESKQTIDFISHLTNQTKQKVMDETEPRIRRIKENIDQLNKDIDKISSTNPTSKTN